MLLTDLDSGPLFEVLGAYRAGARSCPPVPPSNDLRERALGMLAQSEPALELIDRAARKDACHYALNLEQIELPCCPSSAGPPRCCRYERSSSASRARPIARRLP